MLGIVSSNYDIQQVYLDSFLKLARLEHEDAPINEYISQLAYISDLCNVDFIISVSMNPEDLSPELQQYAITDF